MKFLKPIIVVLILVFAGLFLKATDFGKVAASLQRVGFHFIWLIVISFTSYFLGTIAWRFCMGSEGKDIPLGELFVVRHVGETVGLVNPASIVAGEAVKVYLLRNRAIQQKTVITSVLLSRVLMMLTQMMLCLAAALYVVFCTDNIRLNFNNAGRVLLVLLLMGIVIFALNKFNRQLKALLLNTRPGRYLRNRTIKLRGKISEALLELSLFFKNNKKALSLSVLFFIMHWLIGSLEFYVILRMLGIAVAYLPVVFVDMTVILFKSAGAFIPAQIGVEEYGNKVMLATIGITMAEVWVTASILRRARQLFWISFGLGAYFFIDKKKEHLLPQPDGDPVCKS